MAISASFAKCQVIAFSLDEVELLKHRRMSKAHTRREHISATYKINIDTGHVLHTPKEAA